jgi:hypothetical protein
MHGMLAGSDFEAEEGRTSVAAYDRPVRPGKQSFPVPQGFPLRGKDLVGSQDAVPGLLTEKHFTDNGLGAPGIACRKI